jgi:L-ascorbate metabolism protein UlaG (beta-lactamase superfamily)
MRLRAGRPDLSAYAERFDVPAANGRLGITFAGVSTLLIDDGESGILTDGFFSRPGLLPVALRRIAPDHDRITAGLRRLLAASPTTIGVEAVIPVHSHFDHALDSAEVARSTGAVLAGGESTANIGRGAGLPDDRIRVLGSGETWRCRSWTIRTIASEHCPPDRFPGSITAPVVPPAKAAAYRCGEAWSILLEHESGPTALVQGSAGFVPGALADERAEVAYLGVGQLGHQDEAYLTTYWSVTGRTVGARRVVLIHWDDFFRPLPMTDGDPPLRALPYAGDDLDMTMRVFARLAADDQVALSFPTVWRREDPWSAV